MNFTIRVPASSANLGPGFDVIGLALALYLELQVTVEADSGHQLNCRITAEGRDASQIDCGPDRNLATKAALYVLRCHDHHAFPRPTSVHIINGIPLGRGLGSSGAAVVAGVMLANEVGQLGLSRDRLLDFCLMIERHPDNVSAALFGGFVGTYLSELDEDDLRRTEVPLSEVLDIPSKGLDTGLKPPVPPTSIGHYIRYRWSPTIKAILIVPDYEVKTHLAREALQESYSLPDAVFNMQRIAVLTHVLGQENPDPMTVFQAVQDRLHQPYREKLIPGLGALRKMSPQTTPGLLGICLSGAGPSVLALATHNFDAIAEEVVTTLEAAAGGGTHCAWHLLQPDEHGAVVTYPGQWWTRPLEFVNRTIRAR